MQTIFALVLLVLCFVMSCGDYNIAAKKNPSGSPRELASLALEKGDPSEAVRIMLLELRPNAREIVLNSDPNSGTFASDLKTSLSGDPEAKSNISLLATAGAEEANVGVLTIAVELSKIENENKTTLLLDEEADKKAISTLFPLIGDGASIEAIDRSVECLRAFQAEIEQDAGLGKRGSLLSFAILSIVRFVAKVKDADKDNNKIISLEEAGNISAVRVSQIYNNIKDTLVPMTALAGNDATTFGKVLVKIQGYLTTIDEQEVEEVGKTEEEIKIAKLRKYLVSSTN